MKKPRRPRDPDRWVKEATIAWAVCASLHREYAKGKDPFFTTRQRDFVRHENEARAELYRRIERRKAKEGR